ncbi:MAG: hypothetical protein ACI90M_004416 [Candidatus Azotimanducaceae bacterium]|jgi:hypothetical protein
MVRTRIEVQNGNDELTFDSGLVTIGGRTGVNVVLRDVMVADRHCVITYEDGFVVRDSGSVTGTWVNGERAAPAANLEDGTTIIIGTSKLHVSIETDNGTLVLQLKSDPQSFWWKKPGKGAFDNDPDQLAYAETKFGRFPALRLGNRLAMIVGGVVLIAATLLSSVMEPLADPGPLKPSHALVTTVALNDSSVHVGLQKCVELSGQQGCNVCHETGNGTPERKCAQCHGLEGEMAAAGSFRHPYHNDGAIDSQFCVVCHTDHNPSAGDPLAGDTSEWLKPASKDLVGNCAACHDDGTGNFDRTKLTAMAKLVLPPSQPKAFETFAFPHDQHIAKDIDCIVCHRIDDAVLQDNARGVPDNPTRHDFTTVAYKVCTSCHVKDATPVNMTAAQQTNWRSEKLLVESSWHGTDDNGSHCLQCHASAERDGTTVFGPEMKTVDRGDFSSQLYQQERARYQIAKRSHAEQFEKHANGQACTQCHLSGAIAEATQPSARTFWHGLHLPNGALSPAVGQEATVSLDGKASCVSCHQDLAANSATSLTPAGSGNYHWPDSSEAQAACTECHNEGATALRLTAVNSPTTANLRPVPDFPHGVHVGSASFGKSGTLQQGCFACHDFSEVSADTPFSQVPRIKPGASDCTSCHGGHENIAGNDCQTCHPQIEGVGNSFTLQAKMMTPPPATRDWPAPNGFSHLSTGHKNEGCATCHKDSGIDQAKTLAAIRVPDETAASCRDCHLQKQFHWR